MSNAKNEFMFNLLVSLSPVFNDYRNHEIFLPEQITYEEVPAALINRIKALRASSARSMIITSVICIITAVLCFYASFVALAGKDGKGGALIAGILFGGAGILAIYDIVRTYRSEAGICKGILIVATSKQHHQAKGKTRIDYFAHMELPGMNSIIINMPCSKALVESNPIGAEITLIRLSNTRFVCIPSSEL